MRSFTFTLACFFVRLSFLTVVVVGTSAAAQQQKPNVVFILADNIGYGDLGPYGGGELRGAPTPALDQLVREGLRLTQFLVEPGKTEKSARDTFFYYSGPRPSAVRYKNWRMYFAIAPETPYGFNVPGVQTQFMAGMVNLKRDPFETGIGEWSKAAFSNAGALARPLMAWVYDWNALPVGQLLRLKELESYKQFPPLQSPKSWNLDQVTEQIRNGMSHPSQ